MKCAACQHENSVSAKFCEACGNKLARRCSACQAELSPTAKFCAECGASSAAVVPQVTPPRSLAAYTPKHLAARILQSKSALEGERKQVTVLFADVKGSLELAEQAGPDLWHSLLDRFFTLLADGIHRFEGTINQYTGDGVMALFGAPLAHEDHAQRACYAALHLRDALRTFADELRRTHGLSLSTRIGLNSGEVVVGKIGDDLRMDYTAQGHTVGLAQRIEQLAAADSAYLSAHTAHLVAGYFTLRDLGHFDLKGSRTPLRVFELQDIGVLRTRLESAGARGFSKFVGREREMNTLENALDAAISGHGQAVGVVAEAGTGKSRLCLEFVERCKARGIRVNAAHCPAHGKTVPYLPLLEMLRDIFDITPRDSALDARRKIAGELTLLDESFHPLLPYLFEFMNVADPTKPAPPMSAEGRQQRLLACVRQLIQSRSEREPTVLLLDDAHWIDPGSDAFLAHAVEAAAQTRTLWLVNFRPEYRADWMRKSFYQQLPLRPLDENSIAALLADLLGADASVATLPALLHARTGGNPFFIEEIVQGLVEGGNLVGTKGAYRLVTSLDTLILPATVQSVLAARIDRLNEREKRLLQTAAVIGKEFSKELLTQVSATDGSDAPNEAELSGSLAALEHAEFIFETALYPEVEYAFKHPLTQEVAYHSQLVTRRATQHALVASAIEQLVADKLDAHAALLAHHWERAGDALPAAQWHARAARVAGFDSPAEALRHWESVWELLKELPADDEAEQLRIRAASEVLKVGWRQGLSDERVNALFAEAKAITIARGDLREQIRLNYGLVLRLIVNGNSHQALPFLEESLQLANANGEPALRFAALQPYGFALINLGRATDALRMTDEQIILGRDDPAVGIPIISLSLANTYTHRAWALTDLGRFGEAEQAFQSCDVLARQFQENDVISWNEMCAAILYERRGDGVAALAASRRAIDSAERIDSTISRSMGYGWHGMAQLLERDFEGARQSLELALKISRDSLSGIFFQSYFIAGLAEAHAGLGDSARAQALAETAVRIAQENQMPVAEIRAHLSRARILRAQSDGAAAKEIERSIRRAMELIEITGAVSFAQSFERL